VQLSPACGRRKAIGGRMCALLLLSAGSFLWNGCAARWNGPVPPVHSLPVSEPFRAGIPVPQPIERLWTYKNKTYLGAAPAAVGSFLSIVDHKGRILFLDPNSGEVKASAKVKYALQDPPVWDQERFYVVESAPRRRLNAFRFGDGKKIWQRNFTHPPRPPIISGDELWLAAGDTVFALSPATGEALRVVAFGEGMWQRPVPCDSAILLSTAAGLLRLVGHDGETLWERSLELPLSAPPVVAEDGYYVAGLTGVLVKLSQAGEELWRDSLDTAPGAPGARGLCVRDAWLAANSVDGTLWLLDLSSGDVRDTVQFGELISDPPVWAFGRLFVVTENKKLHALGAGP
jgi:outer membrane protein assembly factor BamB